MGGFSRDELLAAPAGFSQRREVRFQDVDAAGIVFFARLLEYFHDAYVAWLASAGVSLSDALARKEWAAPLKHVEADFLRPLRFGDAIEVELVRAKLDGSALSVGYRVRALPGGEAVATGHSVHVVVDASTFRRIEPPSALRAAIEG